MEENQLKLLMLALTMGWVTVRETYKAFDYCDDARNDYYRMIQCLSEKLGVELYDAMDY